MTKKSKNMDEWGSNRDKAKQPRLSNGWCIGCDRNITPNGPKCEICGCRNLKKKRRYKK